MLATPGCVPVLAHAQSACTQLSVPTMALGNYSGSIDTSGAATGKVTCPNHDTYTLGINQGSGSGATTINRVLTSGSNTLTYRLFQDAALSVNWGAVGSGSSQGGTGTSTTQNFQVYPVIPGGQNPVPGSYTDTLNAQVSDNGTSTFSFTLGAAVAAACTISASPLSFGNYTPGSSLTSTATISVTCTNTTSYQVGMDAGAASGATVNTRGMTGPGGAVLRYHLYQDAAHSVGWSSPSYMESGTGTGTLQTLTVYGIILSGQSVIPGAYADTIIANVTY